MNLGQLRRRSGPTAALVLTVWLAQLVPLRAWADEEPGGRSSESAFEHLEWTTRVQDGEAFERFATATEPSTPPAAIDTLQAITSIEGASFPGASRPADPKTSSLDGPTSPSPMPSTPAPVRAPASPQLSLPQGAGKLRGMGESFSAELSTGILSYQVPFELPVARGAAQPSLGLTYSSAGGHGVAGVGWGAGAPAISRQLDRGGPRYEDPAPGGPWHPEQDRFVSGAEELVPICLVSGTACAGAEPGEVMPTWASGWQYFRARVEGTFLRYFWSPDHRTWRVQAKSGVAMEFGVPLDGSNDPNALEVDPSDATRIFSWHLVRMYDAMGAANPAGAGAVQPVNLVVYRYASVEGTSYLTDVFDTPPAGSAATAPLSAYAHHTHLRYEPRPDATHSYRRGWLARSTLRLRGADVTSHDFAFSGGARKLVRRYHLAYDPSSHASLLTHLEVEGRCASAISEDGQGLLPDSHCPRLPPMTFDYQHVSPFRVDGSASAPALEGFEGFDERVRAMAASPPHAINEDLVDFFDVNADALPDVVVSDPARFSGGHGVYFGGGAGQPDRFASPERIAIEGVLGADANVLKLTNPNLAIQDVDGDGVADLLHMPKVKTYSVYTPVRASNGGWIFRGRTVTTASEQSVKVDFSQRNADVRHMDVNADGLMDVVYTGPTAVQTYLSLGRYPGGDGQYGRAKWDGPSSALLSNEPRSSCVPWSATPIRFSDPDVRVADMNGDGFPDIVRLRHGDVRYWPGRGDGSWGTGIFAPGDDAGVSLSACQAGMFGQNRHVGMGQSPLLGMIADEPLLLNDVNGDGLADLVRVRFNSVEIYLNVDGERWTPRHVIQQAPPDATIGSRVRLIDVNGSGTPDIVWGEGHAYKYVDLAGGRRPSVLTEVNNGLGRTTRFEYATSVDQMLAAEADGHPWTTKAPMVAHVVARVIDRDNLERAGRPAGIHVTEYTYRDPVYDGRQREFRGFRTVRAETLGDPNHPTSIAESHFLLGECEEEPGATGHCAVTERWRDNPREALKGRPTLTETFDEAGSYLSTDHVTYRLRQLYAGLDGRAVRHAFAVSTDSYRYDTGPFVAATSTVQVRDVELERSAGTLELEDTHPVTLRSGAGRAHLRSASILDRFGNELASTSFGCVAGCPAVDEAITAHAVPALAPGDGSGWMWRTTESWISGASAPSEKRRHVASTFNAKGLLVLEQAHITGTLPLDRFHEVPAAPIAPVPANAVTDGWYDVFELGYDDFGNATWVTSPAGQCSETTFDDAFAQLVVEASVGAGYVGSATGPAACGSYALTSFAEYDRGLGVATTLTGPGGEVSSVTYDGFGRVTAMHLPDPDAGWVPSAVPSMQIEYFLPTDGVAPYSKVRVLEQDGATASTPSFRESWSYVDGLGRTLVTLTQADPSAGDDAGWIAGGITDFDARGAPYRAYRSAFYGGSPSAYPLGAAPATSYARVRRDAFGRTVETFGLDEAKTLEKVYHALSTDAWDAADLEPGGPHQGTPATERVDGHGRTVSMIERVHGSGGIEQHETAIAYVPTGEPFVITRSSPTAPTVTRWMKYDSFGRMVLNVEPNTTKDFNASPSTNPSTMKAWRYAYDRLGRLVGTSDARGCGTNFYYLADGRPLGEDYSPCKSEHSGYTSPDLSLDTEAAWPVAVVGDGLEVLYRYDGADPDFATVPGLSGSPAMFGPNAGRVTSVSDRGAKTLMKYDARGRVTALARRLARPGEAEELLAARYTSHWYVKEVGYDGADRVTSESTGADVAAFYGAGSESVVTTEYSKRGTVKAIGGSYGALVSSVVRDADGLTEQITYGDVAQTTSVFAYDVRRRLASVLTHRGPPALWSETPPAYSPAPNPGAGPSVFQTVLENASFSYDVVDNPLAITDGRSPSEWPASFKPSTRQFQYDDLYRLKRVDYLSGEDDWTSPYAAENADPTGRTEPSPHVSFTKRVKHQTFAYDALGNTTTTDDDAHGFYDRSLGAITNGGATAGPYQVKQASQSTGGARDGSLSAAYDDAGQLTSLAVHRSGPCLPSGAVCSQRFVYEWDEVGHLSRARRWDLPSPGAATDPVPSGAASAELRYTYAGDERVLKTAVDGSESELHTVYIFGSLELRRAGFEDGEYERTSATMAPYVSASGTRLARLYYSEEDIPTLSSGHLHVLLELADHLGSSSFVLDKATSELVEATRYEAYGATESDYRPERWKAYREDHRFTGKEEDIEVGLTYFGARYYSPALNRWTSADPLAVHVPGEADLNVYAYVHGQVLRAVDPLGLDKIPDGATDLKTHNGETQWSAVVGDHFEVGNVDAPTPMPDAPAPTTALGDVAARAVAGDRVGAVDAASQGLQAVVMPIVMAPVAVARDVIDHGKAQNDRGRALVEAGRKDGATGVAKEYVRQGLARLPVYSSAKRVTEDAFAAVEAPDAASMSGAVGDGLTHAGGLALDVVTVAGASAAARGAAKPAPSSTPAASGAGRVSGKALGAARKEFNNVKPKFWKNEAAANPNAWSADSVARMQQGKAPIGIDGFPMELHHKTPLAEGGTNAFDNLTPLTRTAHRLGPNFKRNHPNLP
ncbi:MAG: VCBS repeat-containing protein [Labilithrix sp.]|nr:VCBS repeat-containing protein [Labilithrix sp.]